MRATGQQLGLAETRMLKAVALTSAELAMQRLLTTVNAPDCGRVQGPLNPAQPPCLANAGRIAWPISLCP